MTEISAVSRAAAKQASSTLDKELDRAAEAVAGADRDASVLLTCHVNPDGDALGSMLGFGLGLRRLGFAEVAASFPEPYSVGEPLRVLYPSGVDLLVPPSEAPRAPELAGSFDAASAARLGELAPSCAAAPTWIVLDHHFSNTGFGTISVVDGTAAATAVLVAALLDRLGVALDDEIATCLYTALATDTGSFKFETTTPQVLELAARLVRAGARPAQVARYAFDTRPFGAVALLGTVLGRAEIDRQAAGGRGLVYSHATLEDLARHRQDWQVLESFIDVIRTTAEADVSCLFKQVEPRHGDPGASSAPMWSVSLRSRGATDVSAVAVALGGGGHRLASGFTATGELAPIVAAVLAELDEPHPAVLEDSFRRAPDIW